MKLVSSQLTLSQLEEAKWHFFETSRDFSNEVTGICLKDNKIFIQLIGGDFMEPFEFWFDYNQEGFNEMWQYEFKEDYHHPIEKDQDTLSGINELATIPYTMVIDLHYTCKHMGMVE